MLKKLALIFIVTAGLFALQPEVTPAPRVVATTEFVLSAKTQEAPVVYVEPATPKPTPALIKSKTVPGFLSIQLQLVICQHFHSYLPVVA